ncbi:hypothetical protein BHQ16_07105 [Mycobacterium shimoidei]|nr:hypothetical protein BHQ16_07105 [Mycobacterium shimoidei]
MHAAFPVPPYAQKVRGIDIIDSGKLRVLVDARQTLADYSPRRTARRIRERMREMSTRGFYRQIKRRRHYDTEKVAEWFSQVSRARVNDIGDRMAEYIGAQLPKVIRSKSGLNDYRTSPYVLMATAGALQLEDFRDLAKFLIDIKLYMGLETSFGKSIEGVVMQTYPIDSPAEDRWGPPIEKVEEFDTYVGLSAEEKSAKRVDSVWREIDSACVHGTRRHLMTIKSGTATINDTQVSGMYTAIRDNHGKWLASSRERFGVDGIDVVIGLTYGTDWTTNNKENQILAKLMSSGFSEVDREGQPGVLQNADGTVRVYRAIGVDYWAYSGNPTTPAVAEFTFLEVLLGLARALRVSHEKEDIGAALNERLDLLGEAFKQLRFPQGDKIPPWVAQELGVTELSWLAAAMNAFFDATKS